MSVGRSIALVVLAMVSLVVGLVGASSCSDNGLPTCVTFEITTPSSDRIQLTFSYDTNGDICSITSGSIFQVSGGITRHVATILPSSLTSVGGASPRVNVANSEATNIIIGFTASLNDDTKATPTQYAGSLGSGTASGITLNSGTPASLVYGGFQFEATPGPAINEAVDESQTTTTNDFCSTVFTNGDPHFSGFHGQQFEVFGFPNAVLNILSDSDMQLNARLVELAEGDCMTYSQMKLVRLTTGDAIPMTKWFDHAGSYMEELGLAIVGGHRLYAKAGAYKNGFESVTFDGEDFPVSATRMFGAGQDAIVIKRVNTHQISVRTPFIRLALVNSDKFLNVEPVSLVKAYDANVHPFAGALGQTADSNFTVQVGDAEWQSKIEKSALVVSNDLFEFSAAQ